MTTLARGQDAFHRALLRGARVPLEATLDLFVHHPTTGRPVDADAVGFQVFDLSTGSPVQTFPSTGRQVVAVAAAVPEGDRLATGHYVARYVVPPAEPLGAHEIRWFLTVAGAAEQAFTEGFTVEAPAVGAAARKSLGAGLYASIQDLRDEGFDDLALWPDARVLDRLELASRKVEYLTGRFFEPRVATRRFSGDDAAILLVDDPVCELVSMRIFSSFGRSPVATDPTEVDLEDVTVPNRHLTQGLFSPDDRDNPKFEFVPFDDPRFRLTSSSLRERVLRTQFFPRGVENVEVTAVWGYTEPSPGATSETERRYGRTPSIVRDVVKRLAARELSKLADCEERDDAEQHHRVVSRRLGTAAVGLAPREESGLTGDPDLDRWLARVRRPVQLAAV